MVVGQVEDTPGSGLMTQQDVQEDPAVRYPSIDVLVEVVTAGLEVEPPEQPAG